MHGTGIDFSIVIPCRDHSLELVRCLQSVRRQQFAGSFEIIVVDAGLDDALLDVGDASTRVVRGREPLRPGPARNLGAAHASGRWLCFIDADAIAEPGWLTAAAATLRAGARVVGGAVLQGERWHPVATIDNLMQFSDLSPGRPAGPAVLLPSCNLALSREDFAAVGGFPVLDSPAGEDVLFCEKAGRRWPGALRFEPAMRVRHYGRRTLRALSAHQDNFGFIRARYGLRVTEMHRRLGRSPLLVALLGVRRTGYLVGRALQWQPAALLAYVLLLPVLVIGMTAWCRGFHRGSLAVMSRDASQWREGHMTSSRADSTPPATGLTTAGRRTPVLMIGIDAAEISLVRKWMHDGSLPNLRALRDRGAFGRLQSTARWLVGSPWPSFYTGTTPADHGMYHYLVWRQERMTHERPAPEWMPLQPFWRRIAASDRKVVAIDVPLAYSPEPFPGIEISGWATHEILEPPASYPPELMDRVFRQFGKPPFDNEEAQLIPAARLVAVRDQCVRTTELVAELGVTLMREQPWDLFMIGFAATHRGGHQLWDRTSMRGKATAEQGRIIDGALRDVYVACDAAAGKLIEQAGSEATVLVFSLHGMGPNASRSDVLREMLARTLADRVEPQGSAVRKRLVDRLRMLVPIEWRSWVKTRLPIAVQDRLTLFWRTGGIDWQRTRAFAAFCDLDGYVRINLRGREAEGIVEPGEEYVRLCDRICEGLRTFVDEDTGVPVVEGVARIDELYPSGRMRAHLPDLMIRWSPHAAAAHRRIVSPQFGAIDWPTPGFHPQGRSGNHWPDGFVLAAGPHVRPGTKLENAHIFDLMPTVYELLDLEVPAGLHGKSLLPDLDRSDDVS